jgi:hypothetical protein
MGQAKQIDVPNTGQGPRGGHADGHGRGWAIGADRRLGSHLGTPDPQAGDPRRMADLGSKRSAGHFPSCGVSPSTCIS